jgi:hypothetical protein
LVAFEFGDGSLLIPVSDGEGNDPGVFLEKGVDAWFWPADFVRDSIG